MARELKTAERHGEVPQFGEFFKFESLGDKVEGIYKSRRRNPAKTGQNGERFKEQTLYDVADEKTGEIQFTIAGNWDLDNKMKQVKIGSYIRVTYASDEDTSNNTNISPMKVYKVEHGPAEKKSPAAK